MNFPDFQRQVEWCQSYFAKMSLKAYTMENWGRPSIGYYPGLPDV